MLRAPAPHLATRTEPYLVKSFVSKGSETGYLNITNYISFESELYVNCSKAIGHTINAIPVLLQTSLLCVKNAAVYSNKRQPYYRMENFVLKGFGAKYLNITNHVSCETELPVDCSKVIKLKINAISFPPHTSFTVYPERIERYNSLLSGSTV